MCVDSVCDRNLRLSVPIEFRDAIPLSGGECNNRVENKLNKINKLGFGLASAVLGEWRVSRRYTLYTYKPGTTGAGLRS